MQHGRRVNLSLPSATFAIASQIFADYPLRARAPASLGMPIHSTSTGPMFYAELRKQLSINDFVTLDKHAGQVQDARPWSAGDWWLACSKMVR